MNQIVIAGQSVSRIEYKNQPVVTFRMMDELHQRPEGTARGAFFRHKEKLIEYEDFFKVPYEEWRQIPCVEKLNAQRKDFLIFLTQSGYLMLVKSFTDNLAWQVQRELVKHYFISKSVMSDSFSSLNYSDRKSLERRIAILEARLKDAFSRLDNIGKNGKKPSVADIEVSHLKRGQWYDIDDFYADSELVISKSVFSRLLTKTVKSEGLSIYRRKKKFIIL